MWKSFVLFISIVSLPIAGVCQQGEPPFVTNLVYKGDVSRDQVLQDVKQKSSVPGSLIFMKDSLVADEHTKLLRYNEMLEKNSLSIMSKITTVQEDIGKYVKVKDIMALRGQIENKQKDKVKFEKDFKSTVRNQSSIKGLYLVILKNPVSENLSGTELNKKVQQHLAPVAIRQLGDNFINAVTTMVNRKDVSQTLTSMVKGKMGITWIGASKVRIYSEDYITLVETAVSPFLDTIISNTNATYPNVTVKRIVNCFDNADIEKAIKDLEIEDIYANELRENINQKTSAIATANQLSQAVFHSAYIEHINSLNAIIDEITNLKQSENNKLAVITQLFAKAGLSVKASATLADTLTSIDRSCWQTLQKLEEERIEIQEKKIYFRSLEYDVRDEGTLDALSNAVIDYMRVIKDSYGNRILYSENILMRNKILEAGNLSKATYRFGEIDKIWVYCIPTNNSKLKVSLFAKFKLHKSIIDSQKQNFEQQVFDLILKKNMEAAGTVSGDGTFKKDSTVTFSAVAAQGYKFIKWQYSLGDTAHEYTLPIGDLKLTDNVVATAIFELIPKTFRVSVDCGSYSCRTVSGHGTYKENESVSVYAEPAKGYKFDRWSENGTTITYNQRYNFYITGDRNLIPIFSKKPIATGEIPEYKYTNNYKRNNQRGILLEVVIKIQNHKEREGKLKAFVYNEDNNNRVYTAQNTFIPGYDNAIYNSPGISLFIPDDELGAKFGRTYYKVAIVLYDEDDTELNRVEWYKFYVDVN